MSAVRDAVSPGDFAENREFFEKNGYLVLRSFYDFETEILPVQARIHETIELVLEKYGFPDRFKTADLAMSRGMEILAAANRAYAAEVYDAVKQIPPFVRLVASQRNEDLFRLLRPGAAVGVAGGGSGIRIDFPGEDKFSAPWHQEFPAQLRSLDGIVFWSPLIEIFKELGPVELAIGSHCEGVVPVRYDTDSGQSGAYSLRLDDELKRLSKYQTVSPLSSPGDLVLIDFLTLHRSSKNLSDRARWSMQFRYFNFQEPIGRKIGWAGSFAAGAKFGEILPELIAKDTK